MKVHFPNKLKLSNKTLVLTKIPKNTNPTVDENISSLFANPNTYLQLPEESKFSFVIGRRLKGPRFDENDNLIPYSIVGEKYFKKKKNLFNNNNSESISFNRSTVRSNTQKLNNNNLSEYINDYQLKNIFNNFKENIEKNKYNNNNNDELYKTINLPKCLEKKAQIAIFTPLHGLIDVDKWGIKELENSEMWLTIQMVRIVLPDLPCRRALRKSVTMDTSLMIMVHLRRQDG